MPKRPNFFVVVARAFGLALLGISISQPGLASYEEGMVALDRWDTLSAISHFERAGDTASLKQLSHIFLRNVDFGVKSDGAKSLAYMRRASASGDPEALRRVGVAILQGGWPLGTAVQDPPQQGIVALERSCAQADALACLAIAQCLNLTYPPCRSRGFEADEAKSKEFAARWKSLSLSAARSGDIDAIRFLATENPKIRYTGEEIDAFGLVARVRNIGYLHVDMNGLRANPARFARVRQIAEKFEQSSNPGSPQPAPGDLDRLIRASLPAYLRANDRELRLVLQEFAYLDLSLTTDKLTEDSALIDSALHEVIEAFQPRLRKAVDTLRTAPVENWLTPEKWLAEQFQSLLSPEEIASWLRISEQTGKIVAKIENVLDPIEANLPKVIFDLKRNAQKDPKGIQESMAKLSIDPRRTLPADSLERFAHEQRTKFLLEEFLGVSLKTDNWLGIRNRGPVASFRTKVGTQYAFTLPFVLGRHEDIFPLLSRSNISTLRSYNQGLLEAERLRVLENLYEKMRPKYYEQVDTLFSEFGQLLSKRLHYRP